MPNWTTAQFIIFVIIAVLWLGGGNLIVLSSLRRQGLPLSNWLHPFVLFKLELRDWLKILLLLLVAGCLAALMLALDPK